MIAVFDNFIKDEKLLKDLSDDKSLFAKPGEYYWWKGWFNEDDGYKPTLKQRLIENIWAQNCPITESFTIAGFEYWTGIQESSKNKPNAEYDDKLDLHFDKDEAWWEKTTEFVTPVIGSIYYPYQADFEGGMLEIYTNGEDNPPEIVYAKPNRLIIFNAGQDVHAVTVVTKGVRYAIAINLWSEEPYSKQIGKFNIEG
jgi:hypothetical protein|tara:strand:- start:398 stop:991 length:594 start_codon:yes stop_codon:yes gene_type:complete